MNAGVITNANLANSSLTVTAGNGLTGGGAISLGTSAAIDITTLSNATDEFDIRVGLCDVTSGADCTDGVYFWYNRNTSVNWIRSTANGGTRTQTASTNAVATGWVYLQFVVADDESSVEFFVNNVSIGSNTLNIPTTAATGLLFVIIKSAGTASRDFDIDYVTFYQHNPTGR